MPMYTWRGRERKDKVGEWLGMFDVLLSSDGEWYTLPLKWRNKKEQPFARERNRDRFMQK